MFVLYYLNGEKELVPFIKALLYCIGNTLTNYEPTKGNLGSVYN